MGSGGALPQPPSLPAARRRMACRHRPPSRLPIPPRSWPAGQQRGGLVPSPVLRPQLLYRRSFYLYLMVSNLLLRLSWAYKLSPHLRDHHAVVFCIVLAEAFRRVLGGRVHVCLRAHVGATQHGRVLAVHGQGGAAAPHACLAPHATLRQELKTPAPAARRAALVQALPVAVCADRG